MLGAQLQLVSMKQARPYPMLNPHAPLILMPYNCMPCKKPNTYMRNTVASIGRRRTSARAKIPMGIACEYHRSKIAEIF